MGNCNGKIKNNERLLARRMHLLILDFFFLRPSIALKKTEYLLDTEDRDDTALSHVYCWAMMVEDW